MGEWAENVALIRGGFKAQAISNGLASYIGSGSFTDDSPKNHLTHNGLHVAAKVARDRPKLNNKSAMSVESRRL